MVPLRRFGELPGFCLLITVAWEFTLYVGLPGLTRIGSIWFGFRASDFGFRV